MRFFNNEEQAKKVIKVLERHYYDVTYHDAGECDYFSMNSDVPRDVEIVFNHREGFNVHVRSSFILKENIDKYISALTEADMVICEINKIMNHG